MGKEVVATNCIDRRCASADHCLALGMGRIKDDWRVLLQQDGSCSRALHGVLGGASRGRAPRLI